MYSHKIQGFIVKTNRACAGSCQDRSLPSSQANLKQRRIKDESTSMASHRRWYENILTSYTCWVCFKRILYFIAVPAEGLYNCNSNSPGCINGGTCHANGTCLCINDYAGYNCKRAPGKYSFMIIQRMCILRGFRGGNWSGPPHHRPAYNIVTVPSHSVKIWWLKENTKQTLSKLCTP